MFGFPTRTQYAGTQRVWICLQDHFQVFFKWIYFWFRLGLKIPFILISCANWNNKIDGIRLYAGISINSKSSHKNHKKKKNHLIKLHWQTSLNEFFFFRSRLGSKENNNFFFLTKSLNHDVWRKYPRKSKEVCDICFCKNLGRNLLI